MALDLSDEYEYSVKFKLRTEHVYDIESRLNEINQLRAWLDELTEWQPDMYSLRFHSSGQSVVAWFKQQDHAAMFALKWM